MSTYRLRPQSPSHYRDPHRASTGNVYATSHDTLSSSHSARSSVSNNPSHASNITYEAQPIRKTIHPDGKKTEYLVRPRHNSTTGQEAKRPLSISTTRNSSPPRRGPRVSASPREIVSAGLPRDEGPRLMVPSSALVPRQHVSHHQRHNSASRADPGSFDPYRTRKGRLYHIRGSEPTRQYYVSRPSYAQQAPDEDWSYTGPREQFARDYPTRPRRDSHSRRERVNDAQEVDRRDASSRKSHAPPPTNRHMHHVNQAPSTRHSSRSGFDSDPDRPNETSRRHQSLKAPAVLHQQHPRDEGYSSSRDDYDSRTYSHKYDDEARKPSRLHRDSARESDRDRRKERDQDDIDYNRHREHDHHAKEHHRRLPRSRETSPERSHLKDIATGTLGGIATAGALTKFVGRDSKDKSEESDEEAKKHHHRRRRHHRREDDAPGESDARRPSDRREESSSESFEDKPHRRRHSRRRSRHEGEEDPERLSDSQRPPRPRSVSRVRPEEDARGRGARDHGAGRDYNDEYHDLDARTISPGENEDDRPRKVMLVEPEKKEDVKPRGILKPARQVPFPEDPNPIREGVAPLKDAKKDGVPPNARWTKISRVLVNPEALEKANERFEERDDYVIVLRVVSREEIQKLADKTVQIRESREREWQKRLEDRKRSQPNGHNSDRSDDEEDEREHLAIEAPQSAPPVDLRNLSQPQHNQQPHQYEPQTAPTRAPNGEATLPDIQVSDSYSQNV